MKNIKILVVVFTLLSFVSYAQKEKYKEKREKITAFKIAYFTEELELTPTESQKFWPLYNAFDLKQQNFRKEKSKLSKQTSEQIKSLSDKEATTILAQFEIKEKAIFDNYKEFIISLKSILSPQKIFTLKMAEENFNRRLLKQYRKNAKD